MARAKATSVWGQYNWLIMTHKECYVYFSMIDAHMGTKEFIIGPLDAYKLLYM